MALEWVDSVFNFKGQAEYNATPPAIADGQAAPLQVTNTGALKVAIVSGETVATPHSFVSSNGLIAEQQIKGAAGTLYEFSGTNESGVKVWVMLFNSTTRPADGATPVLSVGVEADGGTFGFSYANGRPFSTGIYAVTSSTSGTLTFAGGGDSEIISSDAEIV